MFLYSTAKLIKMFGFTCGLPNIFAIGSDSFSIFGNFPYLWKCKKKENMKVEKWKTLESKYIIRRP